MSPSVPAVSGLNNDAQDIARIDPATNKVVAQIKLPVAPHVIAISGNDVWVSVAAPGTSP